MFTHREKFTSDEPSLITAHLWLTRTILHEEYVFILLNEWLKRTSVPWITALHEPKFSHQQSVREMWSSRSPCSFSIAPISSFSNDTIYTQIYTWHEESIPALMDSTKPHTFIHVADAFIQMTHSTLETYNICVYWKSKPSSTTPLFQCVQKKVKKFLKMANGHLWHWYFVCSE